MDFVDEFMLETEGIRVPESFRLWTALATLSGVLERRVWTHTDRGFLYPNMFIILTGSPASGKSLCVNLARNLWAGVPGIYLGPDNPTKRSFLDELEAAVRVGVNGSTSIYCALSVACREFGVLVPRHDPAFLEDLTDLYDNPAMYTAPRSSVKSVNIQKPTINILAAATPDFLFDLLPEVAWGQGFTSRLFFIYGSRINTTDRNIFAKKTDSAMAKLSERLNHDFNEVHGEFIWEDAAAETFNDWYNTGMKPEPDYGRLQHYNGRRDAHTLKLSMLSSVARGGFPVVKLSDFERARSWLLAAEKLMPDVFRAMAAKSDIQLIKDMHYQIYTLYSCVARDKRQPVAEEKIWEYFESRATSDRIPQLINQATKSGWLKPGKYPGTYVPRPLDEVVKAE